MLWLVDFFTQNNKLPVCDAYQSELHQINAKLHIKYKYQIKPIRGCIHAQSC